MVDSKLSFLEVQTEVRLGQAIELGQTPLCVASEAFYPVDVSFTGCEFICSVVNAVMLVKAKIHQSVVTRPASRMDNRSRMHVAPDNTLQCGFRSVRHDFCLDHTLALEQTKDNRLALGSMPSSTSNTVGTEVGLIHFNRTVQIRSLLTGFVQSFTNFQVYRIHRIKRDTRLFRSYSCCQNHRKTPRQLPKLSLADSRTAVVPAFVTISGSYRRSCCA